MNWILSLTVLEHSAFVMAGLLVYTVVTRIGRQRRHPTSAMAWVMAIAAFPYVMTPLFLLFGTRKIARPRRARGAAVEVTALAAAAWPSRLLAGMALADPSRNDEVAFQDGGGDAYRALLALIDGARERLDVSTYVLGTDETAARVAQALVERARAGVAVRLLVDALGSLGTSRRQLRELRAAGVEVRWFMPLLWNPLRGRTNLRNHRKLVVADGRRLWSGGRNLADEYFIGSQGRPAWLDLSFTIAGPVAIQAQAQFDADWRIARGRRPPAEPLPVDTGAPNSRGPLAQWVPSGPDHADDTVHALLVAGAFHARERILAITPYFVPDQTLLDAWCMACRRGVRVTLVLPARSNHWMADIARERALRDLAEAGALVLLLPAMLHAKAVVVDNDVALCGSVNLDGRSLFLNFEASVAFYGSDEIGWVSGWLESHAGRAARYEVRPPPIARDLLEGVVRAIAFQL